MIVFRLSWLVFWDLEIFILILLALIFRRLLFLRSGLGLHACLFDFQSLFKLAAGLTGRSAVGLNIGGINIFLDLREASLQSILLNFVL